MTRIYIFTDESGNQDFRVGVGATRFFMLVSITSDDCAVGDALLALRRELAWDGHGLNSEFHATEDRQHVRDRVFGLLQSLEFRVHATIIEKRKVHPSYRSREHRFYTYAWYEHMRLVTPRVVTRKDEVLVVSATIGTKKSRSALYEQIQPVVSWLAPGAHVRTAHWHCASDPCLQVADYCSWAIQRKWEHGDARSYDLIARKIEAENDIHALSTTYYY